MKKIYGLVFTSMFLFSLILSPVKAQTVFQDVGAQYKQAVDYLVEQEITQGVSATHFGVSQNVKRGDAAVFIARALDLNVTDAADQGFQDLNRRVANEVNAIVEAGIVSGTSKTTFHPDKNITRQEMAKLLSNAYQLTAKSTAEFTDVNTTWLPYVSALKEQGITQGKSETIFAPTDSLTRGEFALFIHRAEQKANPVDPEELVLQRMKEIQTMWQRSKPTYTGTVLATPNTFNSPYRLGKVHEGALTDSINLINFVRYLSYLPGDVQMTSAYNEEAQAASVVNAANQKMTHTPSRPTDMSTTLYDLGFEGANTSNIGVGYPTITDSIVKGYMSDASDQNRVTVGHRRWILSPKLQKTGFGFALDERGREHTAMKVYAPAMWDNPSVAYDTITWPSETAFPTNFFAARDPWSITLNEAMYDLSRTADLVVRLTNVKSGQEWLFSQRSQADGYFTVNKEEIGYTPYTIIFQPKQINSYRQNDQYKVEVENVYRNNGQKVSIVYETTFFDL